MSVDSGGDDGGGGDEVSKLIDHLFLCKLLFCYKLRQWNCIAPSILFSVLEYSNSFEM